MKNCIKGLQQSIRKVENHWSKWIKEMGFPNADLTDHNLKPD